MNAKSPDDEELRRQFEAALGQSQDQPEPAPAPPGEEEDDGPRSQKGVVSGIAGHEVFVEFGPRVQGVLPITEFDKVPQVGQQFEFTVVDDSEDLWVLSLAEARRLATWKEIDVGRWVTAQVTGHNQGGLELALGPVQAFLPLSQLGMREVEDLTTLHGQSLVCEVIEVNPAKGRVILSRRKVLDEEKRQSRESSMAQLKVGQLVRGTVEKIEPFGAFLRIANGVTGLLHVSNMAHRRIQHPEEVVKEGEVLEVQVLDITDGGKRIGLGRKQLEAHPWDGIEGRYKVGQLVQGKVTRTESYGAFVELEPGVEGLLHASQLDIQRVRRVQDVVSVGGEITVRVTDIDPDGQRMSLSRLSERGSVLGSEEDLAEAEYRAGDSAVFREGQAPSSGTNLGDLLRQSLEGGGEKPKNRPKGKKRR